MRGDGLTPAERRLRALLVAHAALSAVLAVVYLAGGETAVLTALPNSFAKDALFFFLSAVAAADVRRRGWLALLIAGGYVALVVGQLAALLWGGAPGIAALGVEVGATAALLAWMAIDLVLAVLFVAWWMRAVRAAHGLRYLDAAAFLGLEALAEVLVEGPDERIPARRVARNVDGYLADLDAHAKSRVRWALRVLTVLPLLTLRPPLPSLDPAARKRFLERRFIDDVVRRRVLRPLRPVVQTLIRTGSQMSYLGYYGDPASWESIGYTPYGKRPLSRPPEPDERPAPPLRSLDRPPDGGRPRYDTIVVGSGAAGGILAHRFAQAGRRVLVLERGPHADPQRFSEDEVAQYLRLYNEGALQLATSFSLQVLQGMCVGGGTAINNALCLAPPAEVLDAWARRGIDRRGLESAIAEVRGWLDVRPIHPATTTVAARRFAEAAADLGLPGRLEVMSANITSACRGCGYCNIGCAFGAKLSTLDAVLPWAQRDFSLDVLADAHVERIVTEGRRATGVIARHGERELVLRADEIVVAAGALGSSWLLQRSGLGGDRVGHGLHFNVVSPLTAEFADDVDSFDGIQMSHAYMAGAEGAIPRFMLETWFNPPATQALAMPGWFDRHFEHMRRYRRMAAVGALVGTTSPGRVKATRRGPRFDFEPAARDSERLGEGLRTAGEILLHAGAERVMPATFAYREYRSREEVRRLPADVRQRGDLVLSSAHPQGGNALGEVVDEDFRVAGTDNVVLCDASVFPSSVHVNPQLTVMGLAQYAARRVLRDDLPPAAVDPRDSVPA